MDFQGLADQIHNTIAETFLKKKNLLHGGVNVTFGFLQMITSSAKIFIAASKFVEKQFHV